MASTSAIEWTDATWNPIVGCSIVSPGCTNCYAMKMAARLQSSIGDGRHLVGHYAGTVKRVNGNPVWTGKLALAPEHILTAPLRWKKPKRVFVNSMGDLFHEDAPDEWIDRVFAVIALAPQHTFQVLTKRPARMQAYVSSRGGGDGFDAMWRAQFDVKPAPGHPCYDWPLPNVWLGVSAERQTEADERIPLLLDTPAAIRFVSCEPLLGPIDLRSLPIMLRGGTLEVDALTGMETMTPLAPKSCRGSRLNWIIAGGESGTGARPMQPDWARSLRDQCQAVGVPFLFKQWGQHRPPTDNDRAWRSLGKKASGRLLDGREWNEFPEPREIAS